MKIYLLTHEREFSRPNNSGSVARASAPGVVTRVRWERKQPCREILARLECGAAAVLYPSSACPSAGGRAPDGSVDDYNEFILLDGTWQEARKMYNRSFYLQVAPRVSLEAGQQSCYRLRRNQRLGGLCTAECVIEILRSKALDGLASAVERRFREFNRRSE